MYSIVFHCTCKVISVYGKKLSVLLEGYYDLPLIVKYFNITIVVVCII